MKNYFDDRKAFNFYRSYYETMILLPEDEQLSFLKAIIEAQFTGEIIDPESNWAKLAFRSQMHSVKKQLIGFNKGKETYPNGNPTKGTYKGKDKGSHKEVQGEEQEQGKEKEESVTPVDESTLHPLQKFIKDSYPNVSSLKTQLTKEQCERLLGAYTKDAIKTKLDAMENKPNLKKNYLAVYNTLNNWLSMERQRNPTFGKLPLTPEQELEILKKERGYHVD